MKIYVFFLIFLISFNSYTVKLPDFDKIETQTELAISYLPDYIVRLKDKVMSTLKYLNLIVGDYRFLEHEGQRLYGDQFYIFDSYFAGNLHKMIPSEEHTLSFANDGSIENIIQSDFGFCAGFTTVTRKFNLGAHFDPQFLLFDKRKLPSRNNREEWIDFFSEKIENILEHSAFQLIPYYKNLNQFMSDEEFPELQDLTKKYIAAYWAYHNINSGGIKALLTTMSNTPIKQMYRFHSNLVNRLNSGINPIYYLAKPSDDVFEKDFWIHVLQAYDVSEIRNGSFTISFWDVNYNELESIKTKVEVKIVKDDKGRSHIKAIFGDLPPGFDDLSNGLKGKKELFDNPFELSGIFEIRKDKEDIVSFINNEDNFDFCDRHRINNTSICYSSIDQYQN